MKTKTALKRVRLELGRFEGFPEGSDAHGYEFIAPIGEDGHIAAEAWSHVKERCAVTRFWGDEPKLHGMLRHVGRGWHFDYNGQPADDDDEPVFKLDRHVLSPGSYISVTEQDGVQRPFRVVSVTTLEPIA